jgi:hypothetical protein
VFSKERERQRDVREREREWADLERGSAATVMITNELLSASYWSMVKSANASAL